MFFQPWKGLEAALKRPYSKQGCRGLFNAISGPLRTDFGTYLVCFNI